MSIYLGNTKFNNIYLGSTSFNKVYQGSNLVFSKGSSYCAEALAYFARMDSEPSTYLKDLINTTFVNMKNAGIWDEIDQYVFMNLHTEQASKLNIKGNYNNQIWYGSPSFTPYVGVTNTTNVSWIDTNFNLSLGTKFTQDNAGIYLNNTFPPFVPYNEYGLEGFYNGQGYTVGFGGYNIYNLFNAATFVNPVWADGINTFFRTDSNTVKWRINGTENSYSPYTSIAPVNGTYHLGGGNMGDGTNGYGHFARYMGYGFGSSMDSTKRATFDTILDNFNENVFNNGTSYTNTGGSGNRTSSIAISSNKSFQWGALSDLINGVKTAEWLIPVDNAIVGYWINFDFGTGVSKTIDEFKFYQSNAYPQGVWKWQGSNEASTTPSDGSFIDIGLAFTLSGATTYKGLSMNGNTTGYRHYRMLGVSGVCSIEDYWLEFEFKIK
jgi:hypothetical protein